MADGRREDEASTAGDAGTGSDPALRAWAVQASGAPIPSPVPSATETETLTAERGDQDGLTTAEAEAAEAEAAAVAAREAAAAQEASRDDAAPAPLPGPAGAMPAPSIPWFMPGHVPDPGPEPDGLPVTDEDAPVTARTWGEADLWAIPRDELDARISNVLPPSRLEPSEWPTAGQRTGAPSGAALEGTGPSTATAVVFAESVLAPESPPPPGNPARLVEATAPAGQSADREDALQDEKVLHATVLGESSPARGVDPPRLTPATLGALVLLVLAAISSFVFMVTRGGVGLPSPAPRTPAAFVTQAPVTAGTGPIASPTSSRVPAAAASPVAATAAPALGATPRTTQAPLAVTSERRYVETDPSIAFAGTWGSATGSGYAGGAVAWSNAAGASATLTFTGRSIAWWGPVGPTRGAATVLIDGAPAGTVSTFSGSFVARRVLFERDFGAVGEHTIRIVVLGTAGHPTVAIDELVAAS